MFRDYFEYGGFPGLGPSLGEDITSAILDDLYSSMVFRDMVTRGNVRMSEELNRLVKYLVLNIGIR